MTKIKKGILGPISGKLGPIVGASWKGIAYIRMAPTKRKKKVLPSPAQLANREKFKFVHHWLTPFHPYINQGFRPLAITKTELNVAFTENSKFATVGTYPNLSIDYSKVILSKGILPNLALPQLTWIDQETLKLQWERDNRISSAFDDQIMFVVYSPALKKADGFIGGIKRAAQSLVFTIHQELIGQDLECYVSLIGLNGKQVSNSFYLGRMTKP